MHTVLYILCQQNKDINNVSAVWYIVENWLAIKGYWEKTRILFYSRAKASFVKKLIKNFALHFPLISRQRIAARSLCVVDTREIEKLARKNRRTFVDGYRNGERFMGTRWRKEASATWFMQTRGNAENA